ncbi:MAG: alpha-2-macroglobulin family protein, partial [Bradyrhizobiaceae bacterium]|nr:alpha-2-macroglobulin family protein [Bradyrhizobiaceae bacterium]
IDGMQGTRGQIRSGGDAGAAELQGSPPTQPPLTLFSGVVTVGSNGSADIAFNIPDFAGTVRVMAVAWSKDKVGHSVGDLIVRDPVVLTTTLPRFLLVGDHAAMQMDIDNVEGPAGEYRVTVQSQGPVNVDLGNTPALQLREKQHDFVVVPISASAVGMATLRIGVSGPGNLMLERNYALAVKPATQILTRRTVKPIAKDESLTLSSDLFSDLVPGTGSVALSVGPSAALDAATLLKALDRYPFGCSEQITSRVIALLYVNDLAAEAHLALDSEIDQRIRDSIDRLLNRQSADGSFGLWSAGGNDAWLNAYVTDFLTRARERGFPVPDVAFKLALDRLRNFVASAPEPSKDGGRNLAYALYVLARNAAAPIGDLRYLADTKLDELATPIAKAQIAAALAMLGDRARAERVFASAAESIAPSAKFEYSLDDYGTSLRDAAAVVTLAAEGGAPPPTIIKAVQRVEIARSAVTYTSTQENAWMVLAARALEKEAHISLDVAGEHRQSPLYRSFRPADLETVEVKVTNTGGSAVQAVVSVSGAPLMPEPAAE